MADITQNILQSIDNIVSQRLGNVSFDRTLVCTILEIYDDRPGIYWVSDGSTKFEAIALDEKAYKKNTRVYVTVPQGDFNKQKIIVGAYTAETAPKYLYTHPMDYLVEAKRYVFDNSMIIENPQFTFSPFGQYNAMAVEMKFQTIGIENLENFSIDFIFRGEYDQIIYKNTIKDTNLYGNPKTLIKDFPQYQLIFIPNIITLDQVIKIQAILNVNGKIAQEQYGTILKGLSIFLGYDKNETSEDGKLKFQTDEVKLYTSIPEEEDKYYYSSSDTIDLKFEWFNAETDKIYSDKNTGAANYCAYWCQQEYGYTKQGENDIELSGVNWKTIKKTSLDNVEAFSYTPSNLPSGGEVKFKVLIVNEDTLDTDEKEYYASNVLALTNKDNEIDTTIINVETLSLSVNNIYHNIYGSDGQLLDNTQKYEVKIFWPDRDKKFLTNNYIRISTDASSLITFKQIEKEGTNEKNSYISTINKQLTEDTETLSFEYYLKENYNPTSVNIIKVEYGTGEGENFVSSNYGTVQLYAGFYNNKFSGYSFNLKCDNPVVYNIENSQTEITPIIISPTGKEITINWNNIKCSWVNTAYGPEYSIPDSEETTRRYNLFNISTDTGNNKIIVSLAQQANMDTVTNYHILKVIYESFEVSSSNNPETSSIKINLVAYLPIGWASSNFIEHKFQGTSMITYDSNQTNPKFLEIPYTYSHPEAENKKPNGINIRTEEKANDFNIESDNYLLSPPALGPSALSKYTVCYYDTMNLSNCFYQQPLYISINLYEYDYLALWDGALDNNAEKNHISSASMFVGEKVHDTETSSTLLSGVLLGSIENLKSNVSSDREIGLYGFEKGLKRFKLGVDGSFFVGDSNNNYISFNERNYRSANNQLFIKTNKFTLDAGNLYLTSNPLNEGDNKDIVFKFNDKINFKKDGSATIGGWTITKNEITHHNGTNDYPYPSMGMSSTDYDYAFYAGYYPGKGAKFKVTHDGTLYATGAIIEGTLTTSFANITGTLSADQISGISISADNITAGTLSTTVGINAGSINGISWSRIQESLNNTGISSTKSTDLGGISISSDSLKVGALTIKQDTIQDETGSVMNISTILNKISLINQDLYWHNQTNNVGLKSANRIYINSGGNALYCRYNGKWYRAVEPDWGQGAILNGYQFIHGILCSSSPSSDDELPES